MCNFPRKEALRPADDHLSRSTSTCLSNGQFASTLTPIQLCGSTLTAAQNCIFSVYVCCPTPLFPCSMFHASILLGSQMNDDQHLTPDSPINGISNGIGDFDGCNCALTWGAVPTSSVFISQSLFGGPSYCGGPVCQVSASTHDNTVTDYCNCDDFATRYSSSTIFQNPCLGYAYTAPVTGTCSQR